MTADLRLVLDRTTPKTTDQLAHQIEALVADYIGHCRKTAKKALEQAFSSPTGRPNTTKPTAIRSDEPSAQRTPRRTAEPLAGLGEKALRPGSCYLGAVAYVGGRPSWPGNPSASTIHEQRV